MTVAQEKGTLNMKPQRFRARKRPAMIPRFTTLLAANPGLTVDDTVDLAQQTWDQLDAYVTQQQNLAIDYVKPSTKIEDIYQRTDLVMRQLATGLSKEFGVKVSTGDLGKCKTFGDLSVLICQKRLP